MPDDRPDLAPVTRPSAVQVGNSQEKEMAAQNVTNEIHVEVQTALGSQDLGCGVVGRVPGFTCLGVPSSSPQVFVCSLSPT